MHNWSIYQKKVFEFVQKGTGNGIINAVAGSGKTTTILNCPSVPGETLFCAFNRDVRTEIQRKLKDAQRTDVDVKTVHQLGYALLDIHDAKSVNEKKTREMIEYLYNNDTGFRESFDSFYAEIDNNRDYPIYDGFPKKRLRIAYDISRLSLTSNNVDALYEMLAFYNIISEKELRAVGEIALRRETRCLMPLIDALQKCSMKHYKERGFVDFTDLLYLPIVLGLSPKKRYKLIYVDECQDLNKAQIEIVKKYLDGRLIAVGDPNQAIYGFAGADAESFDNVRRMFNCTQLPLSICYRCPDDVITLARAYSQDIDGTGKGGSCSRILTDDIHEHILPGDMVLARTINELVSVAIQCANNGNKVFISQDLLFKTDDDWQLFNNDEQKRVLTPEELSRFLEKKKEFFDGFDAQGDSYKPLFDFICDHIPNEATSIERIILLNNIFTDKPGADRVNCYTIHRAKGLEANRVFILGYDGLPLIDDNMRRWQKRQEKNLVYVAITRAMDKLYLCYSSEKALRDADRHRFRVLLKRQPITNFKKGDRVFHEKYGEGRIIEFVGRCSCYVKFKDFPAGKTINPQEERMAILE